MGSSTCKWWGGGASTYLIVLLKRLLLALHAEAAPFLYTVCVLQSQALIILPFFTNLLGSTLADLHNALDVLVASHFPMQSDEFPKGTLRYNNYIDSIKKVREFNRYSLKLTELESNSILWTVKK